MARRAIPPLLVSETAMPIYEYVCMECESHFEELVGMDDEGPRCPDCGAARVSKQFSVFAGPVGVSAQLGGGSSSGGCCGGSCGCGH
jgi:putative FmdB family regulatory protein